MSDLDPLFPRHANSGPAPEVTPPTRCDETTRRVAEALERSRPLVRDALDLGRSLRLSWDDLNTRLR